MAGKVTGTTAPRSTGDGGGFVLSPEQEKVVNHRGGHLQVVVLTGAGFQVTPFACRRRKPVVYREAAPAQKERFTIPTNLRVPADSVIHRPFAAKPLLYGDGQGGSQWESQGKRLEDWPVFVEPLKKIPTG